MVDKQVLEYLKLGHGAFNAMVFFFILYQGLLGYRIRKARLAQMNAADIRKRHRRNGPVLVVLGIAGFFAGLFLVYVDHGHILKYPLHFMNGAAIAVSLAGLLLISGKIKGSESKWRRAHFTLGTVTVFLYLSQLLLGLGIVL